MTEELTHLAAGVICSGFEGTTSSEALEAVSILPLAGFILFSRNAESVETARTLTDVLREQYHELAPILAIDQEGGRVARLRDDVTQIPSARTIGATGQPEFARRAGMQVGHDLRRAGLNLDFAPVLDLALLDDNTVIGDRAFSGDPQVVTDFGRAFANGLQASGIVPTFKHFPGHGSTTVDSHFALPVIEAEEEMIRMRDLMPFANLLPGAEAVMTAHVIFTAFDSERPVTLANSLLQGVLRDQVHFDGVCFTDCMQMDAVAKSFGSEEGSVQALVAGADCILLSNGVELARKIIEAIEQAVTTGRLSLERLKEAHWRVQRLRRRLNDPLPLDAEPPEPEIGREIERAVTAHPA